MSLSQHERFLSLAFCWGELLLELDEEFRIVFAGGLTEALFGKPPEELRGLDLLAQVGSTTRTLLRTALTRARLGGRIQDLYVALPRHDRHEQICQIAGYHSADDDGAGRFFLAVKLMPNAYFDQAVGSADGFADAESFCDMANEALSRRRDAKLTLISIPDLQTLFGELSRGEQRSIRLAIGSFLRAHALDRDETGTMGLGKYGFVHDDGVDVDSIRGELSDLLATVTRGRSVDVRAATITGQEQVDPDDLAKGIVFAINQFKESAAEGLTLSALNANFAGFAEEAVKTVTLFRNTVERSNFSIVFQPIVSLADGSIHHYEVLSRFRGRFGESPYRYICFAEETGLIAEFDFTVIKKTVAWLEAHGRRTRHRFAVNMSGQSLANPAYRQRVDELLQRKAWLKDQLMIELTESARVEDLHAADLYIQHLRGRGVPVCLDDFGAGASSFNYLGAMAVDVVKLDGAAIDNTIGSVRGRAFMKAMGSFCRALGVQTIGEMVDTREKVAFLRECDIDFGQGYLFGKGEPEPAGSVWFDL